MIETWTDCRGCITDIIPNSWFFCLERVAWIHSCSFSGTCASSWRSSNLFTLSWLGVIIFTSTLPWSLISLSTSCHSGNTLLCKETIHGCSTTSGQILFSTLMQQPSPWDAPSEIRLTKQYSKRNRFNQTAWQNQAQYSFKIFDDQYWNLSTIELPRNGAKCKCKLLKSCQANASTKTGRKGCAEKCLENAR